MKVMLLKKPQSISKKSLVTSNIKDPQVAARELLIRVAACAICRTDLQIIEGEIPARQLPIVPGHQIVGIVEKVGKEVHGWKIGDKAGICWLAQTCEKCEFCKTGRENLCLDAQFTGWDRDGGYAQLATVNSDYAFHLPKNFQDANLAPLLCGGIIGYRALRASGIKPGENLGLFGYGASARLVIQMANYWKCKVYVATRAKDQQKQAQKAGAVWVGDYDSKPSILMDGAITFAPTGDAVIAALKSIKRGATVAINAIHLDRIPEFSYDLLWGEKQLKSISNYTRQDAQEFLNLASQIPIKTEVETFSLEKANEALLNLSTGKLKGTAVLVPQTVLTSR